MGSTAEQRGKVFAAIVRGRRLRLLVSDEALISTLSSLNEAEFPRLLRILTTFKTAVSTMITAMPMFIIKNFFRDTLAGFVAGRYWQMPFISTLRGSISAARDVVAGHDEAMRDYLLQGGFYSGLVESEVRVDSNVHGLTDGVKFQKAKNASSTSSTYLPVPPGSWRRVRVSSSVKKLAWQV